MKTEMIHIEEKDVRGSFWDSPIHSLLLNVIAVQQINSLTIHFSDLGGIENKEITQIDPTGIRRVQ